MWPPLHLQASLSFLYMPGNFTPAPQGSSWWCSKCIFLLILLWWKPERDCLSWSEAFSILGDSATRFFSEFRSSEEGEDGEGGRLFQSEKTDDLGDNSVFFFSNHLLVMKKVEKSETTMFGLKHMLFFGAASSFCMETPHFDSMLSKRPSWSLVCSKSNRSPSSRADQRRHWWPKHWSINTISPASMSASSPWNEWG